MSALSSANLSGCPNHPVLGAPDTYDVVSLSYSSGVAPFGTLKLGLEKDGAIVMLRFEGVHELDIDAGFPHSFIGLEILDVTQLGWEHARLRVQSYEDAPSVRFWAKEVSHVAA